MGSPVVLELFRLRDKLTPVTSCALNLRYDLLLALAEVGVKVAIIGRMLGDTVCSAAFT
jgi:hypothetical protein